MELYLFMKTESKLQNILYMLTETNGSIYLCFVSWFQIIKKIISWNSDLMYI